MTKTILVEGGEEKIVAKCQEMEAEGWSVKCFCMGCYGKHVGIQAIIVFEKNDNGGQQ